MALLSIKAYQHSMTQWVLPLLRHMQLLACMGHAEFSSCKSTVSKASRMSNSTKIAPATAAGNSSGQGPALASTNMPPQAATASRAVSSRSPSQRGHGDLPCKPCSSPLSPDDIIDASRQARIAAVLNARVKAATFVLPVGAPGEKDEPRLPQGKGKPTSAGNPTHQQV